MTQSHSVIAPNTHTYSNILDSRYRFYVLFLLWLVALFRFVDLQILAVLLEPIKAEFSFSDTQLALLGGLAFALFYGCLGIPIAWAADRFNRRNIIAISVGLWSLMTALCGMATGFVSLFLARMGVGIGEAGAYPPTTSLLCDYFPEKQRGRVFSILASAIPIGVFVGFLVGGLVSEKYGWRTAFHFVGIPGIVLAFLVHLSVRELPRGFSDTVNQEKSAETFKQCTKALWQSSSYRYLVIAACLFTLGAYGSGIWIPSYFIRHHGFSVSQIGIWMAVLYGGGGLIGSIAGGWLSEYMSQHTNDQSWYMKVCGISMLAILPFACFVFLWPNPTQALCVHFIITVLMHMNIGPVLAMIQALAGVKRRAMAQASNVLVSNMIALPLGPLIVGMTSDRLGPIFGTQTLGVAILILILCSYSTSGVFFFRAAQNIKQDIDAAKDN